jgi:hypothetical protein
MSEGETNDPLGRLWQRPAVRFGLRAAALTGLVISAGAAGVELSGVFDGPDTVLATFHNTCSGVTK